MWLAARWGGAFTPLLVVFVLDFVTWRQSFYLFGSVGFLWAVFFWRWFRDRPTSDAVVMEGIQAVLADDDNLDVAIAVQIGQGRLGHSADGARAPQQGRATTGIGTVPTVDIQGAVWAVGTDDQFHGTISVQVAGGDGAQQP